MEPQRSGQALDLHLNLDYIGLRAHATAVGLLQLTAELVKAGILQAQAVQRIKDAIHQEIMIARPRGYNRKEFAVTLRQRLDAIFPSPDDADEHVLIGTVKEMENALAPNASGFPGGGL